MAFEDLDVYLHIACSQLASSDRVRLIPLFAVCLAAYPYLAPCNIQQIVGRGARSVRPRSKISASIHLRRAGKSGPEGSLSGPQKLFRVRAAFHVARFHRTRRAMIGHISRGDSAARISSDETDA